MIIAMSEKISVLLSDVSIKGDVVEKEKLITDSKIEGDITSDQLVTHQGSKINGNISSSSVTLGGVSKGNINSDKINQNDISAIKDMDLRDEISRASGHLCRFP